MALDNLRGGTKRVVEENTPLNNLRGGTKRVVIVDGGGGSVDYAKTVQRAETMPTADASNAGQQFLYSGESDATYTHGYIYENVPTTTSSSATAAQTVGSTLSDIAVDLATLESFTGWTTDNSLQIFYTADGWSVDTTSLGVTYTGTPNVGDAITITYTAESTSYAWTQIDVQPTPEALPDQTGQSGKFLTTDGTDASWSDKPLVNNTTQTDSIAIGGSASGVRGVAIGVGSSVSGNNALAVGKGASASIAATAIGYMSNSGTQGTAVGSSSRATQNATAVGYTSEATANYAIQLGAGHTNSVANTFKVANANGNFEIMSADGTIPEARLADTTNAAQGQVLTLDSNLNAVWQAGGGGGSLPSQTGNDGKFLTTDGTDASWSDKPLVNNATTTNTLNILGGTTGNYQPFNVILGYVANLGDSQSTRVVAVGYGAKAKTNAIAIGANASANATGAIQISSQGSTIATNSDANTFKVANANGNFELMNANGNLPADRLASTTGLADGNYRLRLTMASGVATLSWVAE